MTSRADATGPVFPWWRSAAALLVYLALAVLCTRPLLERSGSHIAGSVPGDPILNASVLWWNATMVPFSPAWWNPPYFYPTRGVAAFTENLVGVSVTASPIFWLTGNPLTTYNISLFLCWPLSALAAYLLVLFLTRQADAAFLAGLAFGFSPYRMAEYGHIQMAASYWLPLALLGLHGYLARRRVAWLALFAVAWVLQSLANGYMLIMGNVLVGLWVLYFCSTRASWGAAWRIVVAWAAAGLALAPVLLKYRAIHNQYGLKRNLDDLLGFSHPLKAFGEVPGESWLWSRLLPVGGDDLFPGATAVLMVLVAAVAAVTWRAGDGNGGPARRYVRAGCLLVGGLALAAAVRLLLSGPLTVEVGSVLFRMSALHRAIGAILVAGVTLFAITPPLRAALGRRSPLLFYAAGIVVFGLLCLGPVFRVGESVVSPAAPYQWLLRYVPGFDQVRVPTRFWLIGVLCLSASAGLVLARVGRPGTRLRTGVFLLAACGVALDGWMTGVPMSEAPQLWDQVEARSSTVPILELPFGPAVDARQTYRSIWHRRGVFNGASGYDPPHHGPLKMGLDERDPSILHALATFGAFDVVVDEQADPDGELTRFVTRIPGIVQVATDGKRTAYRIPAEEPPESRLGDRLPIVAAWASRWDASGMIDGRLDTNWNDLPQVPNQWVAVDLGAVRIVGGVSHALDGIPRYFPRELVIEVSRDGVSWEEAWKGPTLARAFRAAILQPLVCEMRFSFPPREARYVRLRQMARSPEVWLIAELQIHAPARP
jgi:hypothetical protein